ncbi:hypothetical protein SDC9_174935 [bioreactor metagenome]|uniref:Uncharacterized protein n=1 Tax=bioreactor metagenome TaxID=1076179 RepID=A0A645GKL3_9ZZZZ
MSHLLVRSSQADFPSFNDLRKLACSLLLVPIATRSRIRRKNLNEHEQAAVFQGLLRRTQWVVHRIDGLLADSSPGGSTHLQAGPRHRDTEHLSVLLGVLRRTHLFDGGQVQEHPG